MKTTALHTTEAHTTEAHTTEASAIEAQKFIFCNDIYDKCYKESIEN